MILKLRKIFGWEVLAGIFNRFDVVHLALLICGTTKLMWASPGDCFLGDQVQAMVKCLMFFVIDPNVNDVD
jgi:hypothetical protein